MVVTKNGSRELLLPGDPRRDLPCNYLRRLDSGFSDCGIRPSILATKPNERGEYLRYCEACARKFEDSRAANQVQLKNDNNINLFAQVDVQKVLLMKTYKCRAVCRWSKTSSPFADRWTKLCNKLNGHVGMHRSANGAMWNAHSFIRPTGLISSIGYRDAGPTIVSGPSSEVR